MNPRIRSAGPLVVGLFALASMPATARAGIPIIYGSGDTVSYVAALPASHPAAAAMPGASVGYKYYRFHIYWCDLWTGSGEYCVYSGNQFVPLGKDSKEAAAQLGVPESSLHRPIFYLFPFGWVLVGGFVAVSAAGGMIQSRNSPEARVGRLVKQPLYQEACTAAGAGPDACDRAASFLVGRGVPVEKAEEDVKWIAAYRPDLIPPPPVRLPSPPARTQGEVALDE